MTLFNTADPALRTGSAGEETSAQVAVEILDEGFDLVIMNPPFTQQLYQRSGYIANTFAPAFRSIQLQRCQDQRDMANRIGEPKQKDTCYHGHAGMASAFAALWDIASSSLEVYLALVLPLIGICWLHPRGKPSANMLENPTIPAMRSSEHCCYGQW